MTDLTSQDILDAIVMLDLATKAGGLQVAETTLRLADKLRAIGKEIAEREAASAHDRRAETA